jgi:hypothetical protein
MKPDKCLQVLASTTANARSLTQLLRLLLRGLETQYGRWAIIARGLIVLARAHLTIDH